MKISLIVPVYNEQEILGDVLAKYKEDLANCCKQIPNSSYEIIAVNDGSNDASVTILLKEAKLNRNFKIITLTERFGKQAAITAGFEVADGDVVMVADVDLLNPLGVFEKLLVEYIDGAHIVYGYRRKFGRERLKHRISDAMVNLSTKVFGVDGSYTGKANIMLFSRDVADIIQAIPGKNKLLRTMDDWVGYQIKPVTYESCYTKAEVKTKVKAAAVLDKHQGLPPSYRSTTRDHTSSTIYTIAGAVLAALFIGIWIMLDILLSIGLWWHVFSMFILITIISCTVLFYARSIMIKRIGVVHKDDGEAIYIVNNVVN